MYNININHYVQEQQTINKAYNNDIFMREMKDNTILVLQVISPSHTPKENLTRKFNNTSQIPNIIVIILWNFILINMAKKN